MMFPLIKNVSKYKPSNLKPIHLLFTIRRDFTTTIRIKSSKFTGYLLPCPDEAEKDHRLEQIRQEHPNATHHCYGYIYHPPDPVTYSSDDGEPAGTAGQPILNVLQSARLMNVLMVAVRYYGGTKLGKPGLIEAYGEITKAVISEAELRKIISVHVYKIIYEYNQQSLIDQLSHKLNLITLNAGYTEKVELTLACPASEAGIFKSRIKKIRHLLEEFKELDTSWHIF